MDLCTIYKLTNKTNGKIYIGQTWRTLEERWDSGWGYANNTHLHSAINKYGKDNFEYEILRLADNQKLADDLERSYIFSLNTMNPEVGYNLETGGSNGIPSKRSRLKMSESRRNRPKNVIKKKKPKPILKNWPTRRKKHTKRNLSDKTRKKMSDAKKGKKQTEESNKKRSLALKGRTFNRAYRKKLSDAAYARKDGNSLNRYLTMDQANEIRYRYAHEDYSYRQLAEMYGQNESTIGRIIRNNTYKDNK